MRMEEALGPQLAARMYGDLDAIMESGGVAT